MPMQASLAWTNEVHGPLSGAVFIFASRRCSLCWVFFVFFFSFFPLRHVSSCSALHRDLKPENRELLFQICCGGRCADVAARRFGWLVE